MAVACRREWGGFFIFWRLYNFWKGGVAPHRKADLDHKAAGLRGQHRSPAGPRNRSCNCPIWPNPRSSKGEVDTTSNRRVEIGSLLGQWFRDAAMCHPLLSVEPVGVARALFLFNPDSEWAPLQNITDLEFHVVIPLLLRTTVCQR